MSTQRESSRREWTSDDTREAVDAGSLQRIADATERHAVAVEKMAASCDALRDDRDSCMRMYEDGLARITVLEHRIRSLKGVITRMRR